MAIKKIFIFVFCFIIFSCPVVAQNHTFEEKDFDDPDKLITYFIDSLKDNDIWKAFHVCAINSYSKDFNFTKYVKRVNVLNYLNSPSPSEYNAYIELNKIESISKLARQIKLFYYSILSPNININLLVSNISDEQISAFIAASNPAGVSKLKIVSIDKPELTDSERYKQIALKQSQCFGASDATERIVLLKFDSNFFIMGFHLLKYNTFWRIDSLCSPLSNTPMYGVEKIEFSEYKKRLKL